MAYKVSLTVAALLALSLMIVGVFAITSTGGTFSVTPDTLLVNWTNYSGLGCYASNISLTEESSVAASITIDNATNKSSVLTNSSFIVYNSVDYDNVVLLGADVTNSVIVLLFDSTKPTGKYFGNITLYNTVDTENATINVELTVPNDLSALLVSPNIPKVNVNKNQIAEIIFTIVNNESYDLSFNSISGYIYLNKSGTSADSFMTYVNNVTAGTIPKGTNRTYQLNVTVDTTRANTTGTYSSAITFNTTNGCPWKIYNMPISVNLTSEINTTIESVTESVTGHDPILPGQNMSIRVVPRYWNGGVFVAGLSNSSFTISLKHKYYSGLYGALAERTITSPKVTEAADYYLVDAQIPTDALGGNYTLTLGINDGFGNLVSKTYDYVIIEGQALTINSTACGGATYYPGNTTACKFQISNYGYNVSNNVTLTFTGTTSFMSINVSTFLDIGTLKPAEQADYYRTLPVTVTAVASSSSSFLVAYANSSDTQWDRKSLSSLQFTFTGASTSTTTTTTTGVSNIINTYKHAVTVSTPSAFELAQGGSANKVITVKNTGTYVEKAVALSISGIDSSWYTISTGEQLFSSGQSRTYDVSFKVPESAELGTYSVVFTAKGSTVSGTGTTKLTISPNENTKSQIKTNLSEYKVLYDNLLLLFNQSKAAGKNVSNIEGTLNEITGLITKADSYIETGKYLEAYQTIVQLKTLLTQAQESLTGNVVAGTPFVFPQISPEIIAAGLAGVAVIGVIIYFVKKKPSMPKMNKMPKTKRSSTGFGDKLKDRFQK